MPSSLKAKLRANASSYSPLTALLGTSPFRWYDTQLVQGSAFPAVVVFIVSNPPSYVLTNRMTTSWARVQFTVWDNDPESAGLVVAALTNFFDQLNLIGVPNLTQYPNLIIADRDFLYPQTQPPRYQRILDVRIFSNESL